jgi:hypothetical protein
MSKDFAKKIEAEFQPKDAEITVGEGIENYLLDCEPCAELGASQDGIAGMDVAGGEGLLTAVVDAIGDGEDARKYLDALERDLRSHCENSEESAQVTAIMLAVKKKIKP